MEGKRGQISEVAKMIMIVLLIVIGLAGIGWLIFKGNNAIDFIKQIFRAG